jgi:two-component system response regulator QseB
MKSLLLVDADTQFLATVSSELENAYRLFMAQTATKAIEVVDRETIDLCVLDFFLGDEDGRAVLIHIRRRDPKLPCILVTDRADKELAIEALNLGVNALLEKPCAVDELKARIDAFLPPKDEISHLQLLPETYAVVYAGSRIVLTPIEFQILSYLWERRNHLVRRDEICEKLWGSNKVTDHTFDTHFSNMKRKIPALRNHIQVIRGQGYVLHV